MSSPIQGQWAPPIRVAHLGSTDRAATTVPPIGSGRAQLRTLPPAHEEDRFAQGDLVRGDGDETRGGSAQRASVSHLVSAPQAVELAEWLLAPGRSKPVVVVSIARGRTEPFVDVDRLAAEIGNRAEIYVIPTGRASWALADRLPARTEVYGGAGRVYPVCTTDWTSDPYRAPLRFARAATDATRATNALLADALALAAAGRPQASPSPQRRVLAAVARPGLTETGRTGAQTDVVHQTFAAECGQAADLAAERDRLEQLVRAMRRERDEQGARMVEVETALTGAEADLDRQRRRYK
ncbi:hypothetical protein ASR50_34670 [Streptomyces sp. 4F]|nr:hypothetical protein ASR50_00770 [Streptomyces sp. 4F]ALV54045.1 hypothetical protein ASR50_34670 [Streptomyces sp. 4F]